MKSKVNPWAANIEIISRILVFTATFFIYSQHILLWNKNFSFVSDYCSVIFLYPPQKNKN